jgi:hypothetical protein
VATATREGRAPLAVFLALVSLSLFLSSFPNFRSWMPFVPKGLAGTWWVLPAAAAMALASRGTGQAEGNPWAVRLLAVLLFGAGLHLRLVGFGQPVPTFWDDHSLVWSDIRNVLDLGDRPLLFSYGWREPFHCYGSAALLALFPSLGVHGAVQALSTLSDAALMVVMYFWGRDLGGRWAGLAGLAVAAFTRPVLIMSLHGYGNNEATMAAALAGLTFTRFIRRPGFPQAMFFGLSLAFGATTYTAFRPVAPAAALLALLSLLRDPAERRRASTPSGLIVVGMGALWAFLYLWKQGVLAGPLGTVARIFEPHGMRWVLALVMAGGWMRMMALSERDGRGRGLAAWWFGCSLALALTWPIMSHPMYGGRMGQLFAGRAAGSSLAASMTSGVRTLFDWTFTGVSSAFGSSPILTHGLYDAMTVLFATAGALATLFRPRFERMAVLGLLAAGMSPFILSSPSSPVRVAAGTAFMLALAALGVGVLASALSRPGPSRAFLSILLLLIAWDQHRSMDLILSDWRARPNLDVLLSRAVEPDHSRARVYLVSRHPGFFTSSQVPLNEGRDVNIVEDPGADYPVLLDAVEPPPAVVVFLSAADASTLSRLEKAYPGLLKSPVKGLEKTAVRVEIPPALLEAGSGGMFPVTRRDGVSWRRCFYSNRYGLAKGVVGAEDLAVSLGDPLPPGSWNNATAKASARMDLSAPADLTMAAEASDLYEVRLDGRLLARRDGNSGSAKATIRVRVPAGPHRITVASYFRRNVSFPRIEGLPPLVADRASREGESR